VKREYTILIDDREKTPLPFPPYILLHPNAPIRIITRRSRLATGDYLLASHPAHGVIERKSGLDELTTNLTTSKRSTLLEAELVRMQGFLSPLFLIESSLSNLVPSPNDTTLSHLTLLLLRHRIPLILTPATTPAARAACAHFVADYLIRAAEETPFPHPPRPGILQECHATPP